MRATTTTLAVLLSAVAVLGACPRSGPSLPAPSETPGRATAVPNAGGLPPGHPGVPLGDPASNGNRVGRAVRRLSATQLREALVAATGFGWEEDGRDAIDRVAGTLGRPDYIRTTNESVEATVPFAKLASDAARSACRRAVAAESTAGAMERRLMRLVQPGDTLASAPDAVRRNLAALARSFWGRRVGPTSDEITPLATLFERASTAPASADRDGTMHPAGTPADGWRAVCIAMATDPQFLSY